MLLSRITPTRNRPNRKQYSPPPSLLVGSTFYSMNAGALQVLSASESEGAVRSAPSSSLATSCGGRGIHSSTRRPSQLPPKSSNRRVPSRPGSAVSWHRVATDSTAVINTCKSCCRRTSHHRQAKIKCPNDSGRSSLQKGDTFVYLWGILCRSANCGAKLRLPIRALTIRASPA